MAKPTTKDTPDARWQQNREVERNKIKLAGLINLLHGDAFGDKPISDGARKSAKILLDKVLPDLASMQVAGNGEDGSFIVKVLKFGDNAPK